MSQKTGLTYAEAGVDIDAGNALVDRIKPAAARTARPGVVDGLGGFGALFDLKAAGYTDPVLVAATDGVGTKLRLAIETGIVGTVGIDLVAMCVNDLVCQGAEPLFFLDYFATGALDVTQASGVIEGIAEGCARAGCALIGASPRMASIRTAIRSSVASSSARGWAGTRRRPSRTARWVLRCSRPRGFMSARCSTRCGRAGSTRSPTSPAAG